MVSKTFIKPNPDPNNPKNLFAEIDYPEDKIRIPRRIFNIRTYEGLRRGEATWTKIEPANEFIAKTFDDDEYDQLVKLFVSSKRELDNISDRTSLMNAIKVIDEKVAKVFGKLGMSERLFDYVCRDKRITLPDFTGIGTRPQDSEEKTFYEDEYHLINTMVIISKILFPLFGEIIHRVKNVDDTDSGTKEIIAFGITNTLLNRDFDNITRKLQNYISKLIEQSLSDDAMLIFLGITAMSLTHDKMAKVIVKNFVNFDLYKEDGNIMRSIAVTVKRATGTETSGSNKKLTYKARNTPEAGDDGRNISLLEHSINTSSEAVEVPIIVKIAVDKFIKDYVGQNGIPASLFEDAVNFYKVTLLPPTPINEQIVAMFVADPIGSAYCVKYMDMDMMVKIITIIQIYMMKKGFNTIVPLISMIPTGLIKTETCQTDSHIIINDGRGTGNINYALSLNEAAAHLQDFVNFSFDELMKNLIMFIVGNVHTFNVAPGILALGATAPTISDNGVLQYDENIISELHRFMYNMIFVADPERRLI